jgi:LPPG:FO 2-phospho-L-lactate transferase
MVIALLAGGTGGAKLACGLRDLVGDGLRVIANTADDIEIYGVHVSPDPDLITYRLAGVLDERGFGIAGESRSQMGRLSDEGVDTWFELGDRDFEVCRRRAAALADGQTLSEAHATATAEFDTGGAHVLPMSDEPVRTMIDTPGGLRGVQEFLIADRCEPQITGVGFGGIEHAGPSDAVLAALADADLVVIGPSNPIISIAPILELQGMRSRLPVNLAPVVAVSPYVHGEVVKGPTAKFMAAAGFAPGNEGFARFYDGVADVLVADEDCPGAETLVTDVAMPDAQAARRLATDLLAVTPGAQAETF